MTTTIAATENKQEFFTKLGIDIYNYEYDDNSSSPVQSECIRLSIIEPQKYLTVHCGPKIITWYYHNRKPNINSSGAEETYRLYKGFWKAGRLITPSKTFIKRFNFCPVSR